EGLWTGRRAEALGQALGLLHPSAVVDRHGLPLGELVECLRTGLAVAVARGLHPAERELDLGPDGRRVDVHHAELQLADGPERGADVARVDGARQAVLRGVRRRDGLVEA